MKEKRDYTVIAEGNSQGDYVTCLYSAEYDWVMEWARFASRYYGNVPVTVFETISREPYRSKQVGSIEPSNEPLFDHPVI